MGDVHVTVKPAAGLAGSIEKANRGQEKLKRGTVPSPSYGPAMPPPYKEPSLAERMVSRAHDAKVRATGDWVEGHITTAQHKKIHGRANRVIKAKGQIAP